MDSAIQTTTLAELPRADALLTAELRRWRAAEPGELIDGFMLAWLVTTRIRAVGRERIGEPLLTALAEIDDRHRGSDRYLDVFLDSLLAPHRDRRGSQAYLVLPLLELIVDDTASNLDPVRLSALLMADVICHENRRESRLDPTTRTRRTKHATRFVAEAEPGLDLGVPAPPGTTAGEWLSLTVLPVSTAHDEYCFIRALQAYELVFGTLTDEIRAAAEAARAGHGNSAVAAVQRADRVFRRAAALLRLLATTRADDFQEFGEHAWATGVELPETYRGFEQAYAEVPVSSAELRAAMESLETSHRRWNTVRHGFALRLLGEHAAA